MKDIILKKILNSDGSLIWKFSKSSFVQKYFTKDELDFLKQSFGTTYSEKYWALIHNVIESPKCPVCGNNLKFKSFKEGGYQKYCSNSCTLKGREYKQEWKDKRKDSNIKKYGVVSTFQLKESEEKRLLGLQKKYGTNTPFAVKEIKEKIAEKRKDIIEKSKKTHYEKYGGMLHGSFEISKKINKTVKEKYKIDSVAKVPEIREKIKQTNLRKYGATTYINSDIGFKERSRRYYYNNESFDSSWELAYWIWCKDNNKNIKRNYKRMFFFYENNKKRAYIPDFIVDKQIIEIKSKYIANVHSFEKKKEICEKNNIKIIYDDEIKKYLNYVREKYGIHYLRQFKKKLESDYKRRIIEIKSIDDIFEHRNDNVKFKYNCKQCGHEVITSHIIIDHFKDFLCKKCRKK